MDQGAVDAAARRFAEMRGFLDERQRRLMIGREAAALGRGGIKALARATGTHPDTIARGVREVRDEDAGLGPGEGRARRPGAGRKPLSVSDPSLVDDLKALVRPSTVGDPQSGWRSVSGTSTRRLAAELGRMGHEVSATTVRSLLKQEGYSLQANSKTKAGSDNPDRDAQFAHIHALTRARLAAGQPVISIDTKKKELVGDYKDPGRAWGPAKQPIAVPGHDFPDPSVPRAIPYGVYDIADNAGWIAVGTDHDTSAFAVATIDGWWRDIGQARHPDADTLLIHADGGGSNGSRRRAWKTELAAFAKATGLTITVAHLPPSASKWNQIEHRLFNFITMNWRGTPLTSYRVILDLISSTTTTTGLTVRSSLDTRPYPVGVKITDEQMKAVPITRDPFHGDWNYTIHPEKPPETDTPNTT
jgi:hypothetical protein